MSALDEVRQKYPQYNDWPDDELAEALYEKHYSDMPREEYYKEIGMSPKQEQANVENATIFGEPEDFKQKMENFYSSSGIHGANRGFAKVFGAGQHRENAENAYQEALKTNPKATEAGNLISQLISSIPFIMAGNSVAGAIPKIGNTAKTILGAGVGAGAQGAYEHPENGETRSGNSLKNALVGMAIPAGLKAAEVGGKAIGKTVAKVVPNLGKSLTKSRVAEHINNSFNQAKDKYGKLYGDLFKDARKANVKTDLIQKPIKKITEGIDKTAVNSVKKAFRTNNPSHVNDAQSELGRFIRAEEKIQRANGRVDRESIKRAKKLQKSLNKALDKSFAKSKPELAKRYTDVKSGYKKEVVPYSRNNAIQEFNAGNWVPEDLVKALRGGSNSGKSFRKHLRDIHPEVGINKVLDYSAKGILGTVGAGALGAAGVGGYNYVTK